MSVSGATYFKTGYFVENIVNAVGSWFMIACSFGLQLIERRIFEGKKFNPAECIDKLDLRSILRVWNQEHLQGYACIR